MAQDSSLIDFDSIKDQLQNRREALRGIVPIPIDKIVGSWGRYRDFNNQFLPNKKEMSAKYQSVLQAAKNGKELPPIRVYKVLDKYFVIDGHHRITVAKSYQGKEFIDAEVIEVMFDDMNLDPDTVYTYKNEDAKRFLLCLQEESFQKKTLLYGRILKYPIKVTELASFAKLLEEIEDFRKHYKNGLLAKQHIVFSSLEWYKERFLPAVEFILKRNVLSSFPDRTYTDLYVWINLHKYYLSKESGYDVGFEFSEKDFKKKYKYDSFFDLMPGIVKDIVHNIRKR